MAKYGQEIKKKAIKLSDEIGTKKAAIQLAIPYYTLAGWVNRSKDKLKEEEQKQKSELSEVEIKIRNRVLEREIAELRHENEILKDAFVFL